METVSNIEINSTIPALPGKNEMPLNKTLGYQAAPCTINGLERKWLAIRIKMTIFLVALKCYRSFPRAIAAIRGLQAFKNSIYGKEKIRRCVKMDGKYYLAMYVPGYPSAIFNRFIQTAFNRIIPHGLTVNGLQTIQLAITNKCPLQCEHCFEWNNLNKPEIFTTDELKKIIKAFQDKGCSQFHFTGGEPLVRMAKLEELIGYTSKSSECWVLTSGQNLTLENANRLKKAGAIGVVISLDHFDAAIHNAFRGSENAFEGAMQAVKNANQVKLVTAFSICITRTFITQKNMLQYAELAKSCGVSFVQLLEPKAVGHYEGKAVTLRKEHFDWLDAFYLDINYNPKYKDYPVFIYHGFHQRKIGCQSGGKLILYIDSAGFIDACPFCQTKSYHASDIITGLLKVDQLNIGGCPAYQK